MNELKIEAMWTVFFRNQPPGNYTVVHLWFPLTDQECGRGSAPRSHGGIQGIFNSWPSGLPWAWTSSWWCEGKEDGRRCNARCEGGMHCSQSYFIAQSLVFWLHLRTRKARTYSSPSNLFHRNWWEKDVHRRRSVSIFKCIIDTEWNPRKQNWRGRQI